MKPAMRVTSTTAAPLDSGADTIAIGVFAGEGVTHDLAGGALTALLERGEARPAFKHLALARAGNCRVILVGLGERASFDAERARLVAAHALGRAREIGSQSLCWEVPHHVSDDVVGGLVEGTLLARYRFDLFKAPPADDDSGTEVGSLILSAHHEVSAAVTRAEILATAQNRARDLQNRPPNDLNPAALAVRARELAATIDGVSVDVAGRAQLLERRMGAFAAVAQASRAEPALITLRYDGPGASGPLTALVGKAVTFDSGGLSIKTGAGMVDMKFDMSGGAAVLEAFGAIAQLRVPIRLLAVIGATENVISDEAVRPGDIVRAMDGTSIEVNNTDAEGRLVLADCLLHARELGAERIVDIATLTGGVVTALGSVYGGVFASDDELFAALSAAGERSGELLWRLPLHERYAEAVKGRFADLSNTGRDRKAHPIMGAEFLHHFAGDVPWAHVDMAGMSNDLGVGYAQKGGSGWGVRLLVTLAESLG